MNREEIALKPCPFCGPGQSMVDPWYDDVSKRWAVGCGRCGASSGRSVHAEGSKEAAIKSWNTRALPAQGDPVGDQLVNALSAIEQRANESGTGEMGLLDTVHAMARIARVALALVKP